MPNHLAACTCRRSHQRRRRIGQSAQRGQYRIKLHNVDAIQNVNVDCAQCNSIPRGERGYIIASQFLHSNAQSHATPANPTWYRHPFPHIQEFETKKLSKRPHRFLTTGAMDCARRMPAARKASWTPGSERCSDTDLSSGPSNDSIG